MTRVLTLDIPAGITKAVARPILEQAAVWASGKGLRMRIENQVANMITGERKASQPFDGFGLEPMIIVSHSLGAAVAYRMLLNSEFMQQTPVPLFITLGAALPVKFIRNAMDQECVWPDNVDRWINLYDEHDFVPTGSKIASDEIGFGGIENYEGVELEGGENPHSIGAHLRHPVIGEAIYNAMNGK